jgi:hypothetical protein
LRKNPAILFLKRLLFSIFIKIYRLKKVTF